METKLTDELFEQLATLSKLELTDSKKTGLREDLAQMLTYVDKLGELCTEDTPPLSHFPAQSASPLREDIPCPYPQPEQFVALAPGRDASYYIVPSTLHNG